MYLLEVVKKPPSDAGVYIGLFIGFLAGMALGQVLFMMARRPPTGWKSGAGFLSYLAAVPGLMFGGNWLSAKLLEPRWDALFDSYVKCACLTAVAVTLAPFIYWQVRQMKSAPPTAKPTTGRKKPC